MSEDGISPEEIRSRIARVQGLLRERGLPALLAVGRSFYDRPGPVAYLSGHFPPFPNSVFSGATRGLGHACVLVPAAGEPTLLVDGRGYRRDLVALPDVRLGNDFVAALAGVLRERGLAGGAIGLAGEDIVPLALWRDLAAELPALRLERAEDLLNRLRRIKSPAEQRLRRRSTRSRRAPPSTRSARPAPPRPSPPGPTSCATCGSTPAPGRAAARAGRRRPGASWSGAT